MVDGIVLLVDAAEGPLPQTRFVLRKALARHLPVILAVNKIDRPDARVEEVVDEVYELFLDLDAEDHHIEFPIVYCSGRDGWATQDLDEAKAIVAGDVTGKDLTTLGEVLLDSIPAPTYTEGAPLQAWVTNLDASPYLGRLALLRMMEGEIRKGESVAWCKRDGTVTRAKDRRTVPHRAPHPRAGRLGPSGRPRRRRRHRGHLHRRDAGRSREPGRPAR